MNKLYIDTTSNKEIIVRLTIDGKTFEEKREITPRETQLVLPLLVEMLEKHNLKLSDLNSIDANSGPGSFTGIRVGVAVANALIFALGLKQKLIEPTYS